MKKMKFIEQNEHSECGLACSAMILNYYKRSISLSELRDIYGVPKGGNTLSNLSAILRDYGIATKAVRVKEPMALADMDAPAICFWDEMHFIVLERMEKHYAIILDPALGRRKISINAFLNNFSSIALMIVETNEHVIKRKQNSVYQIVKKLLASKKRSLIIFFFLTILSQGVTIMVPQLTEALIDSPAMVSNSILQLVGVVLGLMGGYYILHVVRGLLINTFQRFFDLSLMREFMKKIVSLPLRFFVNRSTGDLIFRSNLSSLIQQILSQRLITVIVDVLFLFVYIVLMLRISYIQTGAAMVIALLMGIISMFNSRKTQSITDSELIAQSRVQRILVEVFEGIETIKSIGAESEFYDNWETNFKQQVDLTAKKGRYATWIGTAPQAMQFVVPAVLVILGLMQFNAGTMTLGQLVSFNVLVGSFISPVVTIFDCYTEILLIRSYFTKLNEILEAESRRGSLRYAEVLTDIETIELNHVSFKYSHFEEEVLRDISLTLHKNEKIAIVGKSGSGKSTLLKAIANLYDVNEGTIRYNGLLSSQINQESLLSLMSVVTQSPTIFNASLQDNIKMSNKQMTQEQLEMAVQDSRVDEIVRNLPLGMETQISEGGMNLSGGQKQRISIARALGKQPKLLLMDEPTSSLDNISENYIMSRLKQRDFMCIVIAHRLNTIRHFDRIIVMDEGRIVEDGNHETLLAQRGLYYQIYSQTEGGADALETEDERMRLVATPAPSYMGYPPQ